MGNLHLALLFLACYAVLPLRPALGQGIDNSTVFPSLAKKLTCTGLRGFVGVNATFEQKSSFSKTSPIILGFETTNWCVGTDLKEVRVKYGENFDPKIVGNESWTCNVYGNGYNNFTVMNLTIFKPDSNKDNKLTCTYDGKPCPVVLEGDKEYRVVVGMPSNCTAYVDPKGSETTADCGGLKLESSNATLSPSDVAVVSCTHVCCGLQAREKCQKCPRIYLVSMEDVRVDTVVQDTPGVGGCTATFKMALTSLRRERVQVQVMCKVLDGNLEVEYLTFQKRLHSEACRQDVDCLDDLWCVKGRCACPRGSPPSYTNATTGVILCRDQKPTYEYPPNP